MTKKRDIIFMDHDEIRDELLHQLTSVGAVPEYYTVAEKAVQKPVYSGFRRPDIRLLIGPPGFLGIAFDVKTSTENDERRRAMGQLSDYRLSGWHPVIVAKEDVFRPQRKGTISYHDMSLAFNASWVKFSDKKGPKFELMIDTMPGKPGLPHPIGDMEFKYWTRLLSDYPALK